MTEKEETKIFGLTLFTQIFTSLWIIFAVIAFIYSLVCFGKSGSMLDKIFGVLLALFFGPFYFIYLYVYKSYCRK